MRLTDIQAYADDVKYVASLPLPWEKLDGRRLLITGATGQIGRFLIDVLMLRETRCDITIVGRSAGKAMCRFSEYWGQPFLHFVPWDYAGAMPEIEGRFDFILHLASNTHPVAYAEDPVGTISTNVMATKSILDFAVLKEVRRFVYASSVEVYGQNRGDIERFTEDYCGYINCNTLRAGYPESKRCGEALCQAYVKQSGLDVVIPRLARIYGPTLLSSDTKALSQFLFNAMSGKDIVLKSEGLQYFSYLHVVDAVSGILTILMRGTSGSAYNVSDEKSDIRLKDLASLIAGWSGRKVVFDMPNSTERIGFSTAFKALMNSTNLKSLGWNARYHIEEGIVNTLTCLKQVRGC